MTHSIGTRYRIERGETYNTYTNRQTVYIYIKDVYVIIFYTIKYI